MTIYILLFLAGLGGGFLAGLLGIGGGIIYILILPEALTYLHVPQQELAQYIIANSIFGTAAAALAGNIALIRRKEFQWQSVSIVGLGGIVSSYLWLTFFVNTPLYSKKLFYIVVVLLLLYIVYRSWRNSKEANAAQYQNTTNKFWLSVTGMAGGTVSALTGLGGGVIVIPIMTTRLGMNIKQAKAISLGMILITSLSMTVYNLLETPFFPYEIFRSGYIVYGIVIPLSLGVVISSPLGVYISDKLSSRIITYIFSAFVGIVIIKKIFELLS